jgi:hypothetical protein
VCFDFSGNGDSTGRMDRATLRIRAAEGRAVAERLAGGAPRGLIGTSMGAHVAAVLSPVLRPRNLVLFCPAAYPEEATDRPFDERLARPGPYADSPAFRALRDFEGDLLVVAAGMDAVIPREVPELYVESAPSARSRRLVWLDDCEHLVHSWLERHDERRAAVLRDVAAELLDD